MGQDIHFFVELQDDLGEWHLAPHQTQPCPSCSARHPTQASDHCGWNCLGGRMLNSSYYYDLRDYPLFALLGGRGVPDERFPVAGRGMPPDASPSLAHGGADTVNLHDHTFCTLEELQRYPWGSEDFTEFAAVLAKMSRLQVDPRRIRAVYWFDN